MTFEPVPEPSLWMRSAKVIAAIGLVIVAGFAVVGGASYLGRLVGSNVGSDEALSGGVAVEPGQEVTVDIPLGSSAKDIAAILAGQGVVRSALEFEVAVRSEGAAARLQAGTYSLETLMDPAEVVTLLLVGPVADVYRITVIEGLRIPEILTAISETSGYSYDSLEDALLSGAVTTSLKEMGPQPTLTDWEGLLFPDTYEFSRSAEPQSILQRLASTMEQRVDSIDWAVLEASGLTEYEGVIIASLIEAEVLLDDERATVASVIHNRLDIGMKLDIDATILYALDTRDVAQFDRGLQSPYNTYVIAGLPPTPIAAPGRASLEAAASPETTDFLFYVLSDSEGRHAFATNIEDHNRNVNQAREDGVLP